MNLIFSNLIRLLMERASEAYENIRWGLMNLRFAVHLFSMFIFYILTRKLGCSDSSSSEEEEYSIMKRARE